MKNGLELSGVQPSVLPSQILMHRLSMRYPVISAPCTEEMVNEAATAARKSDVNFDRIIFLWFDGLDRWEIDIAISVD